MACILSACHVWKEVQLGMAASGNPSTQEAEQKHWHKLEVTLDNRVNPCLKNKIKKRRSCYVIQVGLKLKWFKLPSASISPVAGSTTIVHSVFFILILIFFGFNCVCAC